MKKSLVKPVRYIWPPLSSQGMKLFDAAVRASMDLEPGTYKVSCKLTNKN